MKIFMIFIVALLATGCATTSDVEESEARFNTKINEMTLIYSASQKNIAKNAKDISDVNVKIDRMFEKAMVK